MTKYDLASYLCNLITIMQDRDKSGAVTRGPILGREYDLAYKEFREILGKEHKKDGQD